MNQSIINNLEILTAAVEAQPEPMFNLSRFKSETECGTLFCTVGLATTIPHFQELGFHIVQLAPNWLGVNVDDEFIADEGVSERYFGQEAFPRLFEAAGQGSQDSALGYLDEDEAGYDIPLNMTDKELALARLRLQIKELKEGE